MEIQQHTLACRQVCEQILREILKANRPDFHYKLSFILLEEETKKRWLGSFRILSDAAIREEEVEASKTANKIDIVKNYVKENFRVPVKVAEVARTAGVSANNFSHFFKQHTQRNFSEYVNSIRIEEATQLLRTTDDTIAEIAYNCGFSSPGYFNDVFRRYKGMTPGEFRGSYEL